MGRVVGVGVIVVVGGDPARPPARRSTRSAILVPALDVLTQLVLVVLRLRAPLLAARADARDVARARPDRGTRSLFALPLAMLAYTGLETVANLAEEARRPGVDLPRSLFVAIGTVVTLYVAIAVVALSAFPGPDTELGTDWLRAPLVGVAERDPARSCRRRSATRSASSSARAAR